MDFAPFLVRDRCMFVLKGDSQIAISFGSVHSRRPSDDSGRDSWRVFCARLPAFECSIKQFS